MVEEPVPPHEVRRVMTAFAPATVSNLAVGFDVLGFAVDHAGDRVTLRQRGAPGDIRIGRISGVVTDLPSDPDRNTAAVALRAMATDHEFPHGFTIDLNKGIPLGSGMGGSAASAVAAVVAANAFLSRPLPTPALLEYALAGEHAASGGLHADNVAPCLLGGLVAVVSAAPVEVVEIPFPSGIQCVLVHPRIEIETRSARAALPRTIPLDLHVRQSMRLAGFLAACSSGDSDLLGRSMVDLVAEPVRSRAIPGYDTARRSALEAGAIGFGLSGSGPSVFAFVDSDDAGRDVRFAIVRAFETEGVAADSWVGPIRSEGAVIEPAGMGGVAIERGASGTSSGP